MKIILVVTTIVTFANGHVDNALSKTKIISTSYSNYHQCESNGERYVERETERISDFLVSQNKSVSVDFQCTNVDLK